MSPAAGEAPAPSPAAMAIAQLADLELRLVTDGRYDELVALDVRRQQALTHLLARPIAPTDRPVLEWAARAQATAGAALEAAMHDISSQLGRTNQAKSAARGYALSARV